MQQLTTQSYCCCCLVPSSFALRCLDPSPPKSGARVACSQHMQPAGRVGADRRKAAAVHACTTTERRPAAAAFNAAIINYSTRDSSSS